MKASYFEERLADLEAFSGWFPRTYVPSATIKSEKVKITSHQSLALIDTALEIKVGVGYEWPPVVLGPN